MAVLDQDGGRFWVRCSKAKCTNTARDAEKEVGTIFVLALTNLSNGLSVHSLSLSDFHIAFKFLEGMELLGGVQKRSPRDDENLCKNQPYVEANSWREETKPNTFNLD